MKNPEHALRLGCCVASAIVGAAFLLIYLLALGLRPGVTSEMPIADFLAVILSALGVMIAILTFFLGVLAFFGWSAFKAITEEKFENLFRRHFSASDPEYGAAVKGLVDDVRAEVLARALREGIIRPVDDEEVDPSNEDANGEE